MQIGCVAPPLILAIQLRRASRISFNRTVRPVRLLVATLAFGLGLGRAQNPTPDSPVRLEDLAVVASEADLDFDATGMGSVEAQLSDEPFSNDLLGLRDFALDADDVELAGELSAATESSPADRIGGEDRLNLRGFPTPVQRNGFMQVGIPETLNANQTIVIQGPLVPVVGRAAPGGIQNFLTARPRTKAQRRFGTSATTLGVLRASLEATGPLQPKRTWQRLALDVSHRDGPEDFAREEARSASVALTWRHSSKASTQVSLDYRDVTALASPGIPEYRPAGGGKIAGPWRPLALFNANGPDSGVRRRSATVGALFDAQPTTQFAFRAGVEAWRRELAQDRFTTSILSLDTGFFEGVREPRHLEQPQQALAAHLEATARARRWGADHKLLFSASETWGEYRREERALSLADRDALPVSVRAFRPDAPDYDRPAFNPARYSRILADRDESADYRSFEASDRLAWRRGQFVVTAGLRHDEVALTVDDRKPGVLHPRTADRTGQLSYHAGINYQVIRRRLLLFGTTSTAFDPSTPVDARTGHIQENETTRGYETGLKGRALAGRFDYAVSGFLLYNEHIARRNPLYNDPVADAQQTQPQLVAAGAERFSGGRTELRWQAAPTVSLSLKAGYTHALTTASPDLPVEVGRAITRLPALTTTTAVRYRSAAPQGGFFGGLSWQYLDGFFANYEDVRRAALAYPGYGLVHAQVGRSWRKNGRTFELEAGLRNLFDRDLLASHARVGAGRDLSLSARLIF